jgi:protein TonB
MFKFAGGARIALSPIAFGRCQTPEHPDRPEGHDTISLPHSFADERRWRSRVISAVLSLAIFLLMVAALISLGIGPQLKDQPGSRLVSVNLSNSSETAKAKTHVSHQPVQVSHGSPPLSPPPTLSQHTLPDPTPTSSFIHLSHADFAAADISRMARHSNDDDSSEAKSAAYGPGEGPGGAHLYNARWYREPTHAEMGTYFPHGTPAGSWALIACHTTDHYHVDDCQELDESPPGSGLARGLRQAAWQFLIRPPMVNGTPIPNAWVRIRFDFTAGGAK